MKVILLQDVPKVGKKYETKDISDGYALNFLLPRKLAVVANGSNNNIYESRKNKHAENEKTRKDEVLSALKKVTDNILEIKAKANEDGGLFAGIDKKSLVGLIKENTDVEIEESLVSLPETIKKTGEYKIDLSLDEEKFVLKLKVDAE